ncbi:SGNH/GDSL hydrolase family protein [Fulvivirga sp. RKSG066]|uniref:SGNH/GDSL hydrolase family protein n=1 Tax=Fulvivirga aurantia TaxID=2529383 RepID=UPI0012BCC063|nr:SGNH/GDSL hydrolase family protein [Fulvivirga aurantia]MTI23271.1 SGNH/GDSL hydrolase family protein [Fulvivirga aurantia]
MIRLIVLFSFVIFQCAGSCHAQATKRLLFIGNSLTYTNNLPQLLEAQAKNKGFAFTTQTIAKPNYALIDHWQEGEIQKVISEGKTDFVIVQQGPSSQPYGRKLLIEYVKKLKKLCEQHNAQLVVFMVWPSQSYYHTFPGVIESHELAADKAKSLLAPVGKVWKSYFDSTNQYNYYGADGFHPSLEGSEVAAGVILSTITTAK